MNKRFGTALITGASSGIGAALARELADSCDRLILVARNEQRLNELAESIRQSTGCPVTVLVQDLAKPGAAEALVRSLASHQLSVDLLVNNAGAGRSGRVTDLTAEEQDNLIALNITALTTLSRLLAADMVARGSGLILNVASTGAYQPGPFTAVYYAAKAYVHSFSLALDRELKGSGVSVSLLCPGATATEFSRRAGKADIQQAMSPEVVARTTKKGLLAGQKLIIPGWNNRLVIVLSKMLPGSWLAEIVARIQAPLIH